MLIGGIISSGLLSFLINLDGIIYNLIRHAYKIFVELAKVNIFGSNDEIFQEMIKRIYMVLGVVMLFVLAYSLLKAVINPDDFSKGDNSVPNIIKNILVSLVIIVILPTVFEVAFNIQNVVINSDVIGKVILNENADVTTTDLTAAGGNTIAYNTYKAFFHPDPTYCINEGYDETDETSFDECAKSIKSNSSIFNWEPADDLHSAYQSVIGGVTFRTFVSFSDAADNGKIEYNYLISTVVGVFLLFMIVSYCLDLGIRVVKLVFLQVIAPIPVICRIIPDKKKAFETWMKETVSTYIEVFIRIAIMYFGVFLITVISDIFDRNTIEGIDGLPFVQKYLILAFIIIGIVLFIKQAPKLIKDLFGIELGGNGLIPLTTMFGLGAAVGAGTTAAVRNFNSDIKNNKGLARSAFSAATGFSSGAARGMWSGKGAKNFKDMKNAASTGAIAATTAKSKREKYIANHGGLIGSAVGHVKDTRSKISTWATGGVSQYQDVIDSAVELKKSNDAIMSEAENLLNKNLHENALITNINMDKINADAELKRLYDARKGGSLSAIEKEIKSREATDLESLKSSYYKRDKHNRIVSFDANGYEQARLKFFNETAQLERLYNTLRKEATAYIVNSAIDGNSIGTIDVNKMGSIKANAEKFDVLLETKGIAKANTGNHVKDNDDIVNAAFKDADAVTKQAERLKSKNSNNNK